jgi:hypothetical protein
VSFDLRAWLETFMIMNEPRAINQHERELKI